MHEGEVKEIIKKKLISQGMDPEGVKIECSGAKVTGPQKGDPWKSMSSMENEKINAESVLDGADVNHDLHQLIGYCWSEGNEKRVFPASQTSTLAETFLKKHNLMPKGKKTVK
jgi:hypothetical protein